MFGYHPVPKPSYGRHKKTARQRGDISTEVRKAAQERAGKHCERCGRHESQVWRLEAAHIERRWKASQEGITAADIIILCGPSSDSGTCHHWADYTKCGREWLLKKRDEIRSRER